MKATDLFVDCLVAEGVDYIFGIPGEENIDLLDSLARSPIQFVLTRHEQAAAFMADAYARVSGKPGVCLATLGPGAGNLITGISSANLERSSVVAITAQVTTAELHKETHQNIDTLQLFKPITAYNQQILSVHAIPEMIRAAFDTVRFGRRGAAHLQLPDDIAKTAIAKTETETSGKPMPVSIRASASPDNATLQKAAALIRQAERPTILAGNGVIRSDAWFELRELVEQTNLPMLNTVMAKGILPFNHELNLFTVGAGGGATDLQPLRNSDLVIAIGLDRFELDPAKWNPNDSTKVLYMHDTPAQADEHFPVVLELVGEMRESLRRLLHFVASHPVPPYLREVRTNQLEQLLALSSPGEALPREIMWILSEQLPAGSYVISDVGLHKVWVSRWYEPKEPGRTIIFNGFASMGGSLPGALACCLVRNDPVVVITGDGGFLMNSQELETAHRLGLSFTIVLFNDGQLSLIKQHQLEANLAVTNISFTNPDFALYAQSFGIKHRKVTTSHQFTQALQAAMHSRDIHLIEVVVNPI